MLTIPRFWLFFRATLSRFKRFDFVFRSHSSATSDPCYAEGVDPFATSRKQMITVEIYRFCWSLCLLRSFASSHLYLHKGRKIHKYYNSPLNVLESYSRYRAVSECVLMPAMSSWSIKMGLIYVSTIIRNWPHGSNACQACCFSRQRISKDWKG